MDLVDTSHRYVLLCNNGYFVNRISTIVDLYDIFSGGSQLPQINFTKTYEVNKVNALEQQFANEYLLDNDVVRAYKVVYPHVTTAVTARKNGNELLNNPTVREYIATALKQRLAKQEKKLEKTNNKKIADAVEVRERITQLARGRNGESPNVQLSALELLGKMHGLFTQNINVNGTVPVVISGEQEIS